jgi:hypothetical protein
MAGADVLLVSAANTTGWRVAVEALAGAFERAGATVVVAAAPPSRRARGDHPPPAAGDRVLLDHRGARLAASGGDLP